MKSLFKDVYKGKKVFITGHTGFKGSWLTLWLKELGAEVKGYSVDIPTEPSHFNTLDLASSIDDQRANILDYSTLNNSLNEFQPEIVFHLAAMPIVNDCLERPRDCFETNLMGSVNILDCIRKLNSVKVVIMITSDKCYENVEWEYGYRENDRLGGKDPYSASKACAELAIKAYMETYFKNTQIRTASVRAGNVIGGGDWARDRIVADLARSWSKSEELVLKNPSSTRPWQHVLEPVSGYLHLASELFLGQKNNLDQEAFNFGPNQEVVQSVGELCKEALKSWPNSKFKELSSGTKHESKLLKLSCDKALHRLGWKPVLNFEETIEMTVHWYKDYYATSFKGHKRTMSDINSYVELAKKRGLPWVT